MHTGLMESLLSEILHLQEGNTLLQDIWLALGPYTTALPDELCRRLQDHFEFDDSE